jgi:hypothetical protein
MRVPVLLWGDNIAHSFLFFLYHSKLLQSALSVHRGLMCLRYDATECSTLKMEALGTPEIPVTIYKIILRDFPESNDLHSRSQLPRGLRHQLSSLARTLGSWVRISLKALMSVCVYSVCVVLCVGSGLATG